MEKKGFIYVIKLFLFVILILVIMEIIVVVISSVGCGEIYGDYGDMV